MRKLAILGALIAAIVATATAASAAVLCCNMAGGAVCSWPSSGSCSLPDSVSVSSPNANGGAQVQVQTSGAFEGLCFKDHSTNAVGDYVAPTVCVRLVAPTGGALVGVSEAFTPWDGHAFAFAMSATSRSWFGGLYMNCYSGSSIRDEQGVATHAVGSGYTCSQMKAMWWNSVGAGGGTFHYLPGVNTAPDIGIQPRISAAYGSHLVGHYDLFLVRTASPNASIVWHRTTNGVIRASIQIGTTDQYGSADVWNPMAGGYWQSSDAGTNTLYINAGSSFISNTLTFTVQ